MDPVLAILYTAFMFLGGSQKSSAQAQEAKSKQRYYNALAVSEEKRGAEQYREIAMKQTGIEAGSKKLAGAQDVAAAAAGFQGSSMSSLRSETFSMADIDKEIIKRAATMAIETSREKASQYRIAGKEAITSGQLSQEQTWLDTASQVAGRWLMI
jgi:hypothetical protein